MRPLFDTATALKRTAQAWYLVTALGLWLFVFYIALFYGPTLGGDFEGWNANPMLTHGYVPGDTPGNLMFAAHVLLAGVLTLGGTIQLVPQMRQRALTLHRWNGRVFMVAALLVAFGGLGLNILRGADDSSGSWPSPIDLNGLLILAFATVAWIFAWHGRIDLHRRWALRTFMVVSGVWFLRLGVSLWILSTASLFEEPRHVETFLSVWKFGCFLFPWAVLELYLWAQGINDPRVNTFVAVLLTTVTLLTAVGIFAVYTVFWAPLI